MGSIPFSIYDFFAYLSAGFVWLVSIDYAFGLNWLIGRELTVADTAFWIVAAYTIGHINAHWSSWLFEGKAIWQRPPCLPLAVFS